MAELTIIRGGEPRIIEFEAGHILMDVLLAHGIEIPRPCGGRGACGKCAVELTGDVSEPNESEIRAKTRLACQAVLYGDATVVLREDRAMEQIEMGEDRRLTPVDPMPGDYGAAVDIGTTTVALRIYDMKTGVCVGESGMLNPQISVAADVMGRIGAAMAQDGARMRAQVTDAIAQLLDRAARQANLTADRVASLVITGNTTMLYLLTGRRPDTLSHAPFQADCLFDETVDFLGRPAYLPRCMHAFVGADITCAVLASGRCERDETALLCDAGTNGELALWHGGELLVTSTAAGPAFEGAGISRGSGSVKGAIDKVWVEDGQLRAHAIGGGKAESVCGSGLIDAVAAALALGEVDETGAMEGDDFPLADGVALIPKDIRQVQLAKAAIAAGIQTLIEYARLTEKDVTALDIAGGFGSHLNVRSAEAIGLFPKELTEKVRVIGNAALDGAARMLMDRGLAKKANAIAALARHVDLGGNPLFNEHYADQMFFPEEDV